MYDELKQIISELDALSTTVYNQGAATDDYDLKSWCNEVSDQLTEYENELQSYVDNLEAAGNAL